MSEETVYTDKPAWQSKKFWAFVLGLAATLIQWKFGVPKEMTIDVGTQVLDAVVSLAPAVLAIYYMIAQGKVDQKLAEKK